MSDTTTETTVQTLAAEAAEWFEGRKRGEGDDAVMFRALKDGRPEWVYELVQEAHGDFFPDDWRYNCIENALHAIEDETESGEFADNEVDVYNGARVAWLGSSIYRGAYCDDAVSEFGFQTPDDGGGIYQTIGLGQYMEANEVYGLVLGCLENRLGTVEDETDSED